MRANLNLLNRRMRIRMSGGVAGDCRDDPVSPYADRLARSRTGRKLRSRHPALASHCLLSAEAARLLLSLCFVLSCFV